MRRVVVGKDIRLAVRIANEALYGIASAAAMAVADSVSPAVDYVVDAYLRSVGVPPPRMKYSLPSRVRRHDPSLPSILTTDAVAARAMTGAIATSIFFISFSFTAGLTI